MVGGRPDLRDLAAWTGPDLDAAHTVGDAGRAGRAGDGLPRHAAQARGGLATANVNVQFANAEAYVDKRNLRVAPGGSLTFSVTNLDGVARHFDVRQLHNRPNIGAQGVLSWGTFDSDVLGDGVDVAAGATETLTVTPADDAFSLWLGDPKGGSRPAGRSRSTAARSSRASSSASGRSSRCTRRSTAAATCG